MKEHWDKHLDVKRWIQCRKPKHILEVGCLEGDNTRNLMSLMPQMGYKLTVISDDLEMLDDGVNRIRGVSYIEIPKLEDNSIDMVILDTDHNYWTMEQELKALHPKLTEGAVIILHDVETFYHSSGMGMAYADGSAYPHEEIKNTTDKMGGMSLAVIDFLHYKRGSYKLLVWIPYEDGACLIEKNRKDLQFYEYRADKGHGNRKGSVVNA